MLKKEANGEILWRDTELAVYKCKCGEEIVIDTHNSPYNECPKCGKRYILHQSNTVFEVSDK
jgi:DNA-directed RNA polymerase subunit RPC12/RpoP